MIFIIATSYSFEKNESYFFWTGKYFYQIKEFLSDKIVDNLSIQFALAYNSKKEESNKNALLLKITRIELTLNYLKLNYKILKEIDFTAYQIKNSLRKYFNKNSIIDIPFCVVVNEEKFYNLLDVDNIENKISLFEKTNNWSKIIELFNSFDNIESSQIWNNPKLLNKFSFASAKLSECTDNLKRKYPDKEQRKKILQEKKYFRELTIKLRKRCIHLENNNPLHYSNLAYTYYQSVLELTTRGGRRDGDLLADCENAILYFDKALELDNCRINDLYRKAVTISEIQTNYLLFKKDENPDKEKSKKAINNLLESIKLFENIIYVFETQLNDQKLIKRYYKYYIKSLFKLAAIKLKIAKNKLNPLNILINGEMFSNIIDIDTNKKINFINQAIEHIEKCIKFDAYRSNKKNIDNLSLLEQARINNFISGVFKIYLYAKIYLYRYILTKDLSDLKTSKNLFYLANETEFPKELKNQRKTFILEKLAVTALLESKFNQAIKLLEGQIKLNNNNKKFILPDYAAYTLSIAYILNGQFEEAKHLISNSLLNCNNIYLNKFNKLKFLLDKNTPSSTIKLIYSSEENVA